MKLRVLGAVVAVAAGFTLTSSGGAVAVGNEVLTADLDAILADKALKGADIGVVVRDANTGDVVYTRQSGRRSQIASNMKLVTTAAASWYQTSRTGSMSTAPPVCFTTMT